MPGRTFPLVTEQYYHIYNRGINKQPIYRDKRDYKRFINIMRYYQYLQPPLRYSKFLLLNTEDQILIMQTLKNKQKLVSINCYCLMPNHFHLIVKQHLDNGISKFISNVQNSYVRCFNTKYKGIGPLLQGRFKSVLIEDENQLLHTHRYVHLNPYSSYIIENISEISSYDWSSFREYINQASNSFCDKELILNRFKSVNEYIKFIIDQADYQRILNTIKHLTLE